MRKVIILILMFIIFVLTLSKSAEAIPAFARKYELSCETCHVAFPRLNSFGKQFVADNMRLDEWREMDTVNTGDDWFGGFAGVDYIPNDFWAFSLLYNYANANDFDSTGTVYEGIDINTITATIS